MGWALFTHRPSRMRGCLLLLVLACWAIGVMADVWLVGLIVGGAARTLRAFPLARLLS